MITCYVPVALQALFNLIPITLQRGRFLITKDLRKKDVM